MNRVDKPWGYELRFVRTERYAGKLLFIRAGHQLSLQYHERKDETQVHLGCSLAGYFSRASCR